MDDVKQIRVVLATGLTFVGFLLALINLTAGSTDGFMEDAALAIVPVPPNPPHYWKDLDWVALYFLCVTAGNYHPENMTRYNITRSKDAEWRQIFTVEATNKGVPLIFQSIGLGSAGLAFIILPLFFDGKRHHNGYPAFLLLLSWVSFVIAGVAITLDDKLINKDPRAHTGLAIPFQWTTVSCLILACLLETVEYLFQSWTLPRQRISIFNKPSDLPWFNFNARKQSLKRNDSTNSSPELTVVSHTSNSSLRRSHIDLRPIDRSTSPFSPSLAQSTTALIFNSPAEAIEYYREERIRRARSPYNAEGPSPVGHVRFSTSTKSSGAFG
jgi:hypothetical protein